MSGSSWTFLFFLDGVTSPFSIFPRCDAGDMSEPGCCDWFSMYDESSDERFNHYLGAPI